MFNIKNTQWFQALHDFGCIMIFGAKSAASQTYEAIRYLHFDIKCYLVSERKDNPLQLDGKPVKVFEEISAEEKENCLIILSQCYENNKNIQEILLQEGFRHMIPSITQITLSEAEELNQYRKSVLGEIKKVDQIVRRGERIPPICVYAVTSANDLHTKVRAYQSKYIRYIQAGAALTDSIICNLTDNTGDNISEKNPYYCEVSAGYWIYKNDYQNLYVGLYHYSRGLTITDDQMEGLVENGVDVVLPIPAVLQHELFIRDTEYWLSVMLKALKRVAPEYLLDAGKYLNGKLFFPGNIVIARKEIYCRYYEWMFLVLCECESIWNKSIPPRWQGYIAEFLTGIYFIHNINKYTIFYASLKSMI